VRTRICRLIFLFPRGCGSGPAAHCAVPGGADEHAARGQRGTHPDAGGEPVTCGAAAFLSAWQAELHSTLRQPEGKGLIRWAVDVDPPRHRRLKTQFCYLWISSQSIRKKRGRLDLSA